MGAGAGAGKNPRKGLQGAGSRAFLKLEPEPVKEIYKNVSKEPGARPFLEGAGTESREPVKKGTGSQTLRVLTR